MPLRRRAIPIILLGCAALLSGASSAQEKEPAAPRAVDSRMTPEARLETLWFQRKDDVEAGDSAAAAGRIEAMSDIIRTERLDRVTWLARGFAYEGYEHLREGNYERAREAFDIARRFDSRMPEAQTGYAWSALKAGRGVGEFLAEYRKALQLRWKLFSRDGRANLYLISVVILGLLGLSLVAIFLLRYQSLLRHDVAEFLPSGWPEGATRLAGWIVLLAPLLAGIGGVWLLLFWCAALARYMSGRERILAAAACASIVAAGPLAAWGAATAQIASDPTTVAVESALQGGYGGEVIRSLREAVRENPDATSLRLLLANTYERADMSREAFDEYHTILQLNPDNPRALNNLANIYVRTGQTAQAIVYYSKAAEADATAGLYYYNLSIAQNEALRLTDAESSIRMVQQLDPNLARSLMTARSRGDEIAPLPASATADEVWKQVGVRSAAAMARKYFRFGAPTVIGAVLTFLIVAISALSRGRLRAQMCVRCGEAFCGKCKREVGARECCAQCIHLFVKREKIAADVRAKKMQDVERHVRSWRRRVRFASVLLPGSGHMLAGSTLTGAVLLLAWLAPLASLAFGRWLVLRPAVPVLDLPGITTILATIFMVMIWTGTNLFVPRPPR